MTTNLLPNLTLIRLIGMLTILSFITLVSTVSVSAQSDERINGYRILGDTVAGPFKVQLQVSPAAPITGTSRFAVRVRDAVTGEDIDDAKVRIFGTPSEEGEIQFTLALNSPFDPIYYLSQMDMENAGPWAIDVQVESDLGQGSTIMTVQVNSRERDGTGGVWGSALFGLVILSFAAGITWLWYSSKKALRRREQQS